MERFSLIDAQQMVERLVGGCRSNTLAPIKGNTFALTKKMQEQGLLKAILGKIKAGTPYIGWSAGSNVCCPTICWSCRRTGSRSGACRPVWSSCDAATISPSGGSSARWPGRVGPWTCFPPCSPGP